MMSLTKNPKHKIKKFFQVRTRRLAKSFEGLNSSLTQSAEELWTCKDTCKLLCLAETTLAAKVLMTTCTDLL